MRHGFTTGSCAAAASSAAVNMLLFGGLVEKVSIKTPKGETFEAGIIEIQKTPSAVSCGVIKDGGDDPDVTTGAHIMVEATFGEESNDSPQVIIRGGQGVGRVTKPGLDQPVGEAAINSTPRKMINTVVKEALERAEESRDIIITVSVPGGEEIAKKTFNPRLGIEGGISIIGTSGVVEPMSTRALIETIRVELNQKKALGGDAVAITPGNYGTKYLRDTYGYDVDTSVKCSNFIGVTVDMVREMGFKTMVFTGHVGKLVKIAGGIMNTHSREADCRMEILSAAALRNGGSHDLALKLLGCFTTEEALALIKGEGLLEKVSDHLLERILFNLKKRSQDSVEIECVLFSNDEGLLAKSKGADKWLTLLGQDPEQQI